MQFIVLLSLVLTAILVVMSYRTKRDRTELTTKVDQLGGQVVELKRVRNGHPFPDTGRGWWAWRVRWTLGGVERTSWALTTKVGITDWRD